MRDRDETSKTCNLLQPRRGRNERGGGAGIEETSVGDIVDMKDPLPVPDQLEKQLAKCKTVRDADTFFKSRDKTKQVRAGHYVQTVS